MDLKKSIFCDILKKYPYTALIAQWTEHGPAEARIPVQIGVRAH